MSERQSDTMRFHQDLDKHITREEPFESCEYCAVRGCEGDCRPAKRALKAQHKSVARRQAAKK